MNRTLRLTKRRDGLCITAIPSAILTKNVLDLADYLLLGDNLLAICRSVLQGPGSQCGDSNVNRQPQSFEMCRKAETAGALELGDAIC